MSCTNISLKKNFCSFFAAFFQRKWKNIITNYFVLFRLKELSEGRVMQSFGVKHNLGFVGERKARVLGEPKQFKAFISDHSDDILIDNDVGAL